MTRRRGRDGMSTGQAVAPPAPMPAYDPARWVRDAAASIDLAGVLAPLASLLLDGAYRHDPDLSDTERQARRQLLAQRLRALVPLYELTTGLIRPYLLSAGEPTEGDHDPPARMRHIQDNLLVLLDQHVPSRTGKTDPWQALVEWLWINEAIWTTVHADLRLGQPEGVGGEGAAATPPISSREQLVQLLLAYAQQLARVVVEILDVPHAAGRRRDLLLGGAAVSNPTELLPPLPLVPPKPPIELAFEGYFLTFGADLYHALRAALYSHAFTTVPGKVWPTALLSSGPLAAEAQLRPPGADDLPEWLASQATTWIDAMWEQHQKLSDTDADALDALCALWLARDGLGQGHAVTSIDELLSMRGLRPKPTRSGRRSGFTTKQRRTMQAALERIQNLWLTVAIELSASAGTAGGGQERPRVLQSRAFVITERIGQLNLDGRTIDLEGFVFRPGEALSNFLAGPGAHTARLSARALSYDPVRQSWEKRLARYFSWQWHRSGPPRRAVSRYTVKELLDAACRTMNRDRPGDTREHLEEALDTLQEDGIIASWQYGDWDEQTAESYGWWERWLGATVVVAPPSELLAPIADVPAGQLPPPIPPIDVQAITREAADEAAPARDPGMSAGDLPLSMQLRAHRRTRRLNQLAAAGELGISQGYLSKLERGQADQDDLDEALRSRLLLWMAEGR